VLSNRLPDTPAAPTFALDIATKPEPQALLLPLRITTAPPVIDAADAAPPVNCTIPAANVALLDAPPVATKSPPNPDPPPTRRLMEPPRPPVAKPVDSNM